MSSSPPARILVVDDDHAFRRSTSALLEEDGYHVSSAADGQEAVEALRAGRFDLMLLDLRMPGTDGLGVVQALRVWGEGIPILMITGFGSVDTAVRALHLGADDFLSKPVEPEVLSHRVAELLERRPGAGPAAGAAFAGMIGRSAALRDVADAVTRVAPTEATVLITGETGTGKELVARAVHNHSARRAGPFVAVNCASLADGLLESELFGHVRGAFTGASHDRAGLFETAARGTLFLDEIGDVSPALQLRLLRSIQEREVRRVGASRATPVDVRIVAATHRDLREEVAAGRFREDLFYPLNVFPTPPPPLRAGAGDIPVLVEGALAAAVPPRAGSTRLTCSPLAMRMLLAYDWPGNIRELLAAVESAAIRTDGDRIEAHHLPAEVRGSSGWNGTEPGPRYQAERAAGDEQASIVAALDEAAGNRNRAADILGMGRTTLWRKMKSLGIEHSPEGET